MAHTTYQWTPGYHLENKRLIMCSQKTWQKDEKVGPVGYDAAGTEWETNHIVEAVDHQQCCHGMSSGTEEVEI